MSHALLRYTARTGEESLRMWTPPRSLSFGRLDLLLPGATAAITAARAAGLAPVKRLAGGRAAAVGPGTLAVGWAAPASAIGPPEDRYATLSQVILEALRTTGVPARTGELDGEWCPGRWSILAGDGKVGGLAQRAVRGGAWTEAVLVLSGARELAAALTPVQAALGRPWSPATLTAVTDAAPHLTRDAFEHALREALAGRWSLTETALTPELAREARSLSADHDLQPDAR